MPKKDVSIDTEKRAALLFERHTRDICLATDRLFAWLLPVQWAACIFYALWFSPKAWSGTSSSTHPHVWTALVLGGAITVIPSAFAFLRPGMTETRYLVSVAQMLIGSLLIHLAGGRIETHFHVFGSLAILAFYRDWKVMVPASLVVAFDHWIRGVYWPQSIFGILTSQPWRWAEHIGWVIFENIFLISSCLRSQTEMKQIANARAREEKVRQITELEVAKRTRDLENARSSALNMMQDAEEARGKAESTAAELKREMSERRKIENQLIQSQKMETVGTLAGGIAHDLNNQLTPVKGYIDLILSDTLATDPNYPMLVEANLSVERCSEIIHRLLNFSRTSTQRATALSVQRILRELKGLAQKFLPSTISIEIDCPEDVYPVEGNETELETVFMNFATNARDAMPNGGKLRFTARNVHLDGMTLGAAGREGDHVLITTSDTGNGIPTDVLNRIFEPFFTTKKKGEGTGLGLAMVFKIVKESGGWIDVSSRLGEGTTFQVYLPAKRGAKISDSHAASSDVSALLGKGETILFADDEEMIRKMSRVLLEKLGYKVLMCSDAQEVVEVYREKHKTIDALLVDMTMPKLTGQQMLKQIFEIRPDAKVIVASGYTSEGGHSDIKDMGAADFLQKPYTIVPMAKALRAILSGSI